MAWPARWRRRGGRVEHDGDVDGDVACEGVYAGGRRWSRGGPGDVCGWGGDAADGDVAGDGGDRLMSIAPADLGDGTTRVAVTVTATVWPTVRLGADACGVGAGRRATATLTVTLLGTSCDAGDAGGAGGGPGGVCRWCGDAADVDVGRRPMGSPTASIRLVLTRRVQSVVVTATLDRRWVAAGRGVGRRGGRDVEHDGDVDGDVAAKACTPVSPVEPGVVQATCTRGGVPPTVTLPSTAGIV